MGAPLYRRSARPELDMEDLTVAWLDPALIDSALTQRQLHESGWA